MQPVTTRTHLVLTILTLITIGLYSCKTAEQAKKDEARITEADSAITESGINLATYRNSLGDLYATQQHDMPKIFMESHEVEQSGNRDPFDGYRIQVVSTRDVSRADSVAKSFRVWADTTIAGFSPETYVFFKQPYFKVHIGDFSSHDRAIEFSQFVKRQYPDAWVVHDRINPYHVPADTVDIRLKTQAEKADSININSSTDPNQ